MLFQIRHYPAILQRTLHLRIFMNDDYANILFEYEYFIEKINNLED